MTGEDTTHNKEPSYPLLIDTMVIAMSCSFHRQLVLGLLLCLVLHFARGGETCDEDGVCQMSEDSQSQSQSQCGLPETFCHSSRTSVYRHGGTAQAYKAEAPSKSSVCDSKDYSSGGYRVATWPFSRSSRGNAPHIVLKTNLWSCDDASQSSAKDSCCCKSMTEEKDAASTVVEVWQTRPDGTYSSLRQGQQEGDCRALLSLSNSTTSTLVFETVAPGSTGSLSGLGPSKWEFMPYGPPSIHFLVTSPGHAATLLDLPILLDSKTLNARSFRWPDWRGSAWTKYSEKNPPFKIVSWKGDAKNSRIEIELDIFLQVLNDPANEASATSQSALLCQSWLHSSPSSFFLEPMSECAPSMLDFFAL
jgi:hypothetical protein